MPCEDLALGLYVLRPTLKLHNTRAQFHKASKQTDMLSTDSLADQKQVIISQMPYSFTWMNLMPGIHSHTSKKI